MEIYDELLNFNLQTTKVKKPKTKKVENVLLVSVAESYIKKAVETSLISLNLNPVTNYFDIDSLRSDIERYETKLLILFITSELNNKFGMQRFISDLLLDYDIRCCVIGDYGDIEKLKENFNPNHIALEFRRPVNVRELGNAVLEYIEHANFSKKVKILLLDDSETQLKATELVLGKKYQVLTTKYVAEAFQMLVEQEINIVVLDYNMTVITGLQFYQALKEYSKTANTHVIFLTSANTIEDIKLILAEQPDSYILKAQEDTNQKLESAIVNILNKTKITI